jgi:hypothetical protein
MEDFTTWRISDLEHEAERIYSLLYRIVTIRNPQTELRARLAAVNAEIERR